MNGSFRGIGLRQVADDDIPFLFRLFADPERSHLWMRGRRVYDEQGFHEAWAAWSAGSFADKFIVTSAGRAIGLAFYYDRTLEDGYTKMTVLLEEASTGHGAGVIATALFTDWLFKALPLRKIYHEVFSYNPNVVRMHRKFGLAEEGVLKGNRYWDGQYWDLHIFTLDVRAWPEARARLLREPGRRAHVSSAKSETNPTRDPAHANGVHCLPNSNPSEINPTLEAGNLACKFPVSISPQEVYHAS